MCRSVLFLMGCTIAGCAATRVLHPQPGSPLQSASPTSRLVHEEVLVPDINFVQGHEGSDRADETPARAVHLSAFYIDKTLVTRQQFTGFVEATGYRTQAERAGFGVVAYEGMGDWEWERAPGATFRAPFRRDATDQAEFLAPDAPVVMVSWHDAQAYCKHVGKRLPTEAEWEGAMRAGQSASRYPWGEEPKRDGKYLLNFWQGESHERNSRDDGYVYVSGVRAFPPNAWGIYDPVGNVWQWTADAYAADAYAQTGKGIARDPVIAPKAGDESPKYVLRGGSWWCGACTCEGNGLHYRGKASADAAFNNNGFRCARSATR
jgi:formylglycine-generating enzyme